MKAKSSKPTNSHLMINEEIVMEWAVIDYFQEYTRKEKGREQVQDSVSKRSQQRRAHDAEKDSSILWINIFYFDHRYSLLKMPIINNHYMYYERLPPHDFSAGTVCNRFLLRNTLEAPLTFKINGNVSYTPTFGGISIPGYKLKIGFNRFQWVGVKFMSLTSRSTYDVVVIEVVKRHCCWWVL